MNAVRAVSSRGKSQPALLWAAAALSSAIINVSYRSTSPLTGKTRTCPGTTNSTTSSIQSSAPMTRTRRVSLASWRYQLQRIHTWLLKHHGRPIREHRYSSSPTADSISASSMPMTWRSASLPGRTRLTISKSTTASLCPPSGSGFAGRVCLLANGALGQRCGVFCADDKVQSTWTFGDDEVHFAHARKRKGNCELGC